MNLRLLLSLLFYCAAICPVAAENQPIDGQIIFRGKIDGKHFTGSGFHIEVGDDSLLIRAEKSQSKFKIPIREQKLSDAILSSDSKAVAVVLDGTPWPSRRKALATSNADGVYRVFPYKTDEMTKELGWIIELGAVSGCGSLVLAKCAFMMPAEGDTQRVNHKWVVLRVGHADIEVVETDSAIERWSAIIRSEKLPE